MKITIAAIGKDKNSSPTQTLFRDYIKRISWDVTLKEFGEKKSLPPKLLMEKEAEMLLEAVPSNSKIIILDETGKNIASEEFAKLISKWQDDGHNNLSFLIGGAAGHGNLAKEKADFSLSLGKMTWPHMMARAMLAEQIYRAHTIISGHPYHRG